MWDEFPWGKLQLPKIHQLFLRSQISFNILRIFTLNSGGIPVSKTRIYRIRVKLWNKGQTEQHHARHHNPTLHHKLCGINVQNKRASLPVWLLLHVFKISQKRKQNVPGRLEESHTGNCNSRIWHHTFVTDKRWNLLQWRAADRTDKSAAGPSFDPRWTVCWAESWVSHNELCGDKQHNSVGLLQTTDTETWEHNSVVNTKFQPFPEAFIIVGFLWKHSLSSKHKALSRGDAADAHKDVWEL